MTESSLPATYSTIAENAPEGDLWISRCLLGEQAAYIAVYNQYAGIIYRLCLSLLQQKEDAEALAATIREQDKQISRVYKDLKDTKSKNEKEKAYLHKKIRDMAHGFSKRKDKHVQTGKANAELKDAKSKYETENLRLQKKIRNLEELLSERKNQ